MPRSSASVGASQYPHPNNFSYPNDNFNPDRTSTLISREELDDIKARVDLRDLAAQRYGWGKHIHNAVQYCSPLRDDDHTPSFTIYADGYKDYGDGEYGDVIAWIMLDQNLSFPEAVMWLLSYLNTSAGLTRRADLPARPAPSPNEPPDANWQIAVRAEALEPAEEALWNTSLARNYLIYGRALTEATIRHFHLGYNPHRRSLSYCPPGEDHPISLASGILIPYINNDAVWAVNLRRPVGSFAEALLHKDETDREGNPVPKYTKLAGAGGRKPLFNQDAVVPGKDVLFVEGEFDAMLAHQEIGDAVAAVTFGSASNIPNHMSVRQRERMQAARDIYVVLDNDDAGEAATQRLVALFTEIGKVPILYPLPEGKDATEFVVDYQGDLRSWWEARPRSTSTAVSVAESPQMEQALTQPQSRSTPLVVSVPESTASLYGFPGGLAPVGWQQAINHYTAHQPGGAILFAVIQQGLAWGTIRNPPVIRLDEIQQTFKRLGWSIPRSNLYRWWAEGEFPYLPPSSTPLGVNFENARELAPLSILRDELIRRHEVDMRVRYFRSIEGSGHDFATGKTYRLPVVPADLSAQMFIDAGLDEVTAQRAAEDIQKNSSRFDAQTQRRRAAAEERVEHAQEEFMLRLDDTLVVPPSAEIRITSERDYKVALVRAWHGAGIERFVTVAEQLWALGIGHKGTLNSYLKAAGVAKEKQVEAIRLDPTQEVGEQVKAQMRQLQARPISYVLIDPDGVKTRAPYQRDEIDTALQQGEVTLVEYQKANHHYLIEVPPLKAKRLPRRQPTANGQKPGIRHVQSATAPGTYPPAWLWNHLAYRYQRRYHRTAPPQLSTEQLIDELTAENTLQAAAKSGAVGAQSA